MIQADTCYVPRGPHRGKVGGQQAKESTHAKRHRAAGDTQRFDSTDPEAVFQYMRRTVSSAAPLEGRRNIIRTADRRVRRRWLQASLRSDFVLHHAVVELKRVIGRRRRIDRTFEVSATNSSGKRRLTQMVTMNLVTLEHLLSENRRDFLLVASRHATPDAATASGGAWDAVAAKPRAWSKNSTCGPISCGRGLTHWQPSLPRCDALRVRFSRRMPAGQTAKLPMLVDNYTS